MELRRRQVHLDFHTSEKIGGVGRNFDPERFARAFLDAHVDSVTLFSRCHHGWLYHDSDKFPELKHPGLERDLLAEQIEALHRVGIRAPVYITVGWDERAAREHPEWREVHQDGRPVGAAPLEPGWRKLDMLSPYIDFVAEQTAEVIERFGSELDGLWFDIIFVTGAHSVHCMREYDRLGLDPAREPDVKVMKRHAVRTYLDRMADVIPEGIPVFHNSGHVGPGIRPNLARYSHLELESLPTGGWGYAHFPVVARYARTLGKPFLGMTGKFSETWGHFQSYKPEAALEFECLSAVALGGACSVGDQLPPDGVPDARTYELIGKVYGEVARREPWTVGATAVREIAVLNVEGKKGAHERLDPTMIGALRALVELGYEFDFVSDDADLSGYGLLVLPDKATVEEGWVSDFVAGGGAVLATGESFVDAPWFPAVDQGPLPHASDYRMEPGGPVVMYERGRSVTPRLGAEVGATVGAPYFDRAWDHFCSHAHAPFEEESGEPAVVRLGRVTYLAHPIFETYGEHSMILHRDMIAAEIERLLPERLVETPGAPRSLQTSLTLHEGRHVLHLMHYVPERRGLRFDVVEDRLPLYDIEVRLRVPGESATWEPEGLTLSCERQGDTLVVHVPKLVGHGMIVVK